MGCIVKIGWGVFARPYLFLLKGASRCVDFQSDLDAPHFTTKEAKQVIKFAIGKNMFSGIGAAMKKPESLILYLIFIMLAVILLIELGVLR
jgi:hypothetical protein